MAIRENYQPGEQLNHDDWNQSAAKVNQPTISAATILETSTRQFVTPTQKTTWDAKAAMSDITNALNALKAGVPVAGDNLLKLYNLFTTLNTIVTGTTPDGNTVTNTIQEILAVFATYPEGVDMVTALAGKVATTAIDNTFTTAVAGKVADARTVKALKDLIDGLNAASLTFTNKTLSGLNNNFSNIRAGQLYPADTMNVDAANISSSAGSALKTIGGPVKYLAFGVPYYITASLFKGLVMYHDGEITYSYMPLNAGEVVNGLKFPMWIAGQYTADVKFNGGGLYKFTNGVLNLVAVSANLPDVWKTAAKSFAITPFTSPYTVPETGIYYAASMFSATSVVALPELSMFDGGGNNNFNSIGFAANAFLFAKSGYDGSSLPVSISATDPSMRRNDFPDPIWVGGY